MSAARPTDVGADPAAARRRLRDALQALHRITGSARLERLNAARSGVSIGYGAVSVLGRVIEGGPIRMSDLAAAGRMHPAALTRQVQALEAEGYVERRADPGDGRASVIVATASGRGAYRRVEASTDAIMAEQLSGWSPTELAALVDQLDRLVGDLRAVPASRTGRSRVAPGSGAAETKTDTDDSASKGSRGRADR
ncbi:MarR family winged helix-turn-helix transcriptional regulator [Rhabdothermincola salaria]|uniref:MarR family winged helix-turn-helix transcriptional regulator n=1 Tax=Rhabdothermincola salaria TaxID=2903142 RepID=UPI001E2D8358|nr:MarR family winged helix-turn-helix transcriptional regulator [Rhabdothermincola salaria]MCD9623816.1 MarR family winged helix-turn-helix transcriptional regulator [Rhabdothermincola salaria]